MFYVSHNWSFISAQFFVLNLVGWFDNKCIIFLLFHYYTILISVYLLWIFRNFRNYSSNFITNKLPVASAVFWITLFEKVLSASFLAWLGIYQFTVFTNQHFTYIFTNVFSCIFSKRPKSIAFYKYSISSWNWISSRFTL